MVAANLVKVVAGEVQRSRFEVEEECLSGLPFFVLQVLMKFPRSSLVSVCLGCHLQYFQHLQQVSKLIREVEAEAENQDYPLDLYCQEEQCGLLTCFVCINLSRLHLLQCIN